MTRVRRLLAKLRPAAAAPAPPLKIAVDGLMWRDGGQILGTLAREVAAIGRRWHFGSPLAGPAPIDWAADDRFTADERDMIRAWIACRSTVCSGQVRVACNMGAEGLALTVELIADVSRTHQLTELVDSASLASGRLGMLIVGPVMDEAAEDLNATRMYELVIPIGSQDHAQTVQRARAAHNHVLLALECMGLSSRIVIVGNV